MTFHLGIFSLISELRLYLYETGILKTHNAEAYTISVGNISTGGTGKTPIALHLLAQYTQEGKKVAYLSRGYGRKTKGFLQVIPTKGNALDFGEESLLVANRFPNCLVAVCEDRVLGAKKMKEIADFDILILDDAFQHFPIYRDEDIVVIDAQKLPFEDKMLPLGRLREPLSALKRADTLIINKVQNPQEIPTLKQKFAPYIAGHTKMAFCCPKLGKAINFFTQESKDLKGLTALVFAGIGNNDFFLSQLKTAKVNVQTFLPFPDHHFYTETDMAKILTSEIILTTEKDYYRIINMPINSLQHKNIYYVPMELHWLEGEM